MKALSLREPSVALIAAGKKKIETRSWKTSYRGPLYIHASAGKIRKNDPRARELLELIPNEPLRYGMVVCRCTLADCRYMGDAFLREMEKDPLEKFCGDYREGRYAWFLEDIQVLSEPFPAKGMLGLWALELPDKM